MKEHSDTSLSGNRLYKATRVTKKEMVAKAVFAATTVLVLVACVTDVESVRVIGPFLNTLALAALIKMWDVRCRWLRTGPGVLVLCGLGVDSVAELIFGDPDNYDHLMDLSFLLALVSAMFYMQAFWLPTVPTHYLKDATVSMAWGAEPSHTPRVPLAPLRAIAPLAVASACCAYWGLAKYEEHPSTRRFFAPSIITWVVLAGMVWRAWARIGYRVPPDTLPIAEADDAPVDVDTPPIGYHRIGEARALSPEGSASTFSHMEMSRTWLGDSEVVESRLWQYCGAIGATSLALGYALHGYCWVWHHGVGHWAYVLHVPLVWIGHFFIAMSVPCVQPQLGTLTDPAVCPTPFGGPGYRVLCPLPDDGFNVAEVAVPWFLLRRRGHQVVFATSDARKAEADPTSLDGIGCLGIARTGCGPLIAAMYAEMQADQAFTNPIAWAGIMPDAFDGMLLPCGHTREARAFAHEEVLLKKVSEFWSLGRPIGAIATGMLVLANTVDATGAPVLTNCTATSFPKYMERSVWCAFCCCACCSCDRSEEYVEEAVIEAVGPRGRFLRGPLNWGVRGTPWDDGPAFVVEDGNLVTARWGGDAYLFGRRFMAKLEEVERMY